MKNVLNKSCRENQNTHLCYVSFFRKSHRLRENVEKCDGARGATNDVTTWRIRLACWISKATRTLVLPDAHAPGHPHLGIRAHTHTNRYTYCFSTATTVSRTRLNITLHVHYCLLSPHFSFPLLVIPPVLHTRLSYIQQARLRLHARRTQSHSSLTTEQYSRPLPQDLVCR